MKSKSDKKRCWSCKHRTDGFKVGKLTHYHCMCPSYTKEQEDMNSLQDHNQHLWNAVKKNLHVAQAVEINKMKKTIILLIKEAIQVGAMIEKYEQDLLT